MRYQESIKTHEKSRLIKAALKKAKTEGQNVFLAETTSVDLPRFLSAGET